MQHDCKLYLITPPQFDLGELVPKLHEALATGEIACLQLRMKDVDYQQVADKKIIEAAKVIMPICQQYDVQFILNDNPELAKKLDTDGVHIGEEDGSVADAREILGENKVIGCSCYDSKHRAMVAGEEGADYVAFGAFYATKTKQNIRHPEVSLLQDWSSISTLPCVAIGGIKPKNLTPIVRAGADFIAVVTGIWEYDGSPSIAIEKYIAAINQAKSS